METKKPETRERYLREYFTSPRGEVRRAIKPTTGGLLLVVSGMSIYSTIGASNLLSQGCVGSFVISGTVLVMFGSRCLVSSYVERRRWQSKFSQSEREGELDELLRNGIDSAREHLLATLGISEESLEIDPIVLISPIAWPSENLSDEYQLARVDASGNAKFGAYTVAVLALTEHMMAASCCQYSFVTGKIVSAQGSEVRYKDIVSVSTCEEERRLSLPSGERRAMVRELRISMSNGDSIRFLVDVPELCQQIGVDSVPHDSAERAVRAIRAMMR